MQNILERIKKVEALIAWATSKWEKNAAEATKKRILEKYPQIEILKDITEIKITSLEKSDKKLLKAISRKYWLEPYRYYRQKYSTLIINCNVWFFDEILWPEYIRNRDILDNLVDDITWDIISKIHKEEEDTVIRGELN